MIKKKLPVLRNVSLSINALKITFGTMKGPALHKPEFIVLFGGRKSEDFAENTLPRISMFTSSRVWSDFGRISQQIRGFQIDYERGLQFGL
jgi:hypothetical protein